MMRNRRLDRRLARLEMISTVGGDRDKRRSTARTRCLPSRPAASISQCSVAVAAAVVGKAAAGCGVGGGGADCGCGSAAGALIAAAAAAVGGGGGDDDDDALDGRPTGADDVGDG